MLKNPATWMLNYHTGVLQPSFSSDTADHKRLSLEAGCIRIVNNILKGVKRF